MEISKLQQLFNQRDSLYKEIKEIRNNISILKQSKELCDKHNISEKQISGILYLINVLELINDDNANIYKDLLNEIEYQQSICKHDLKYIGHDSHYDYYKCSKCGYEHKY